MSCPSRAEFIFFVLPVVHAGKVVENPAISVGPCDQVNEPIVIVEFLKKTFVRVEERLNCRKEWSADNEGAALACALEEVVEWSDG